MPPIKRDPAVQKLANQLLAAQNSLRNQGGVVPKQHPSLISRAFDVISRPNYAVASAFDRVVNKINENKAAGKGGQIGQLPGLLSGGLWTGLEGKTKTHFSDVLAHGGVKNPIVRTAAGLGADLALDPSAYVGAGFVKAAPDIEGVTQAGKAIQAGYGVGVKADTLNTIAQQARAATRPGALTLKVAGSPVARSERAYEALAKIGRPIAQSGPVDTAHRLLSTRGTFVGGLNSARRVGEQQGISEYLRREKILMDRFKKLPPEAGGEVARATERGLDLSGRVVDGIDLGDLQRDWMDLKNHYDSAERSVGFHRPGQGVDTYVPKKFASSAEYRSAEAERFRDMERRAQSALNAGKKGAFPTFDQVKAEGLRPHENMLDIARLRSAEGERTIARTTFKNDLVDEMAVEFNGKGKQAAITAAKKAGLEKVKPDLLRNTLHEGREVYLPKEAHHALQELDRLYTSSEESQKFIRMIDGMSRIWKTGVTTINPGHHLRNMVGDAFLAWEGGVKSPLDFERGAKVLSRKGEVKIGGHMISGADLNDWYHLSGGASGFFNTELIGATTPGSALANTTSHLNRGMEKLRNVVSQREDFMRLGSWTHALRDYADTHAFNGLQDMEKAAAYATEHVKKFHFDYGDLTHFETNVRRVIPFYTFMRKNIPLQLEMLAMHPNKISKVPKAFNALQTLLGTDSGHLPISEVVPAFIKDMGAVRVRGEGGGHNALYLDPQLPLAQGAQMFTGSKEDVLRRAIGQSIARPIAELGFKKSALTGQPINTDLKDYAINQFPYSRTAQQLLSPHKPQRVIQPGEKTGSSLLQMLNSALPVGIREVTPQSQRSELQRQLDPVQARIRAARTKRINAALRSGRRR